MKTSDFDYQLAAEYIAQTPIEPRDHSRLMILDRPQETLEHRRFYDIANYLRSGDLLVCNESRVIPARLCARRADTGGRLEILLLKQVEDGVWETLVKPGKRARPGTNLIIEPATPTLDARNEGGANEGTPSAPISSVETAEVLARTEAGGRLIRFSNPTTADIFGAIPLPPYIKAPLACPERYQTVYSRLRGSVAAPTAGLHFTPELIGRLQEKGVELAFVTLHIGLDTFRPVAEEEPAQHPMHSEYCEIGEEAAAKISRAKAEGRRVIAVGTTTVRTLESAARAQAESLIASRGKRSDGGKPLRPEPLTLNPFRSWTQLFILPGSEFKVVDALITNFHLPRSTLLMLVSAFAGREFILRAYAEAIRERYRFFSFGDAMLIH